MKLRLTGFFKTGLKYSSLGAVALLGLQAAVAGQSHWIIRDPKLTDFTGSAVQIPDVPKRVVTLAPSLAELAADLLGDDLDRIVGVTEYTDYPPVLKKVTSVGSYARFNLEKVAALKPDVVFATRDGNPKDQVLHLKEIGIRVIVVSTSSFQEIRESIRIVGEVLGRTKRAQGMIQQLLRGVERVKRSVGKGRKPRVLLQAGDEPLVVMGADSFLHEALETVGAVNVYGNVKKNYLKPSLEDVIGRDPDIILVLALGDDLRPFQRMVGRWNQFKRLKAVKAGRVRILRGDPVLRPSMRLLEGLSLLKKAVDW